MPPTLRGVLLDIDGTLLDSNDAHASAWVDVFTAYGYDIPFDRVRRLIGMGGDKLVPELIGEEAAERDEERMAKERTRRFQEHYLPKLRPTDGARALVERLRAEGLRIVVATSANEEELDGLLQQAGVADLIERATTSSDADASKPDPDIIEAALQRGALQPGEVLMVGDTPYDVTAAARAGVATVAVRSGGWTDEELHGAIAVYASPAGLLREWERSPFAERLAATRAR